MSEAGPSAGNIDIIHDLSQAQTEDDQEAGKDLDTCDGCDCDEKEKGPLFFCQPCKCIFCFECWEVQAAHRPTRKNLLALALGDAPHERTELQIVRVVQPAFVSAPDKATLEARLTEDEDAAWFGISGNGSNDTELYFHDHGRFDELMTATGATPRRDSESSEVIESPKRTPSLTSFVGETGAGKSTLIKLLIQLKASRDSARHQCPVVGSPQMEQPTSEDVHLYLDPATSLLDTPILYADCEGLEAGTREPLAATVRGKREKREGEREDTGTIPKRPIKWAKSTKERTRNFAVECFYPRLLFTFSDVVVFVDRNPRSIESVLVKLIEWAAAALEAACNQPILPFAIIVLNASRPDIDQNMWDVDNASLDFMESLAATIHRNAHFLKFTKFWKERGRTVETIEQLILCYYTSLRVVRIPTDAQPNLVLEQARKLYQEIENGCHRARDRKQSLRMLLDADTLQSHLQHAFDHYTQTLDVPFDFIQASFLHNPIPINFGGNILKLAIALKDSETKPNRRPDGRNIFKKISNLVASCIMLDAIRHRIPGTAELIFPQYLHHLDAALRDFCGRYWPCEYIQRVDVPDKWKGDLSNLGVPANMRVAALLYRCVNVQSGHSSKGHQMKTGRTFARGGYTSTFSFENNQKEFHAWVYFRLENLLTKLEESTKNSESLQSAAAQVHRTKIREFYLVSNRDGALNILSAHNVCWCCLFGPPEHSLSCGHILCTECIKAYGYAMDKTLLEIHECPLESYGRQPKKVYIKPEFAGIRTLALEDIGTAGIAQLEILRMIEEQFNGKLPIQFLFDAVIGRGMSSIIALGIFAEGWTIDQCSVYFERICKDAFSSKNRNKLQKLPSLREKLPPPKYNSKMFERSLKNTFAVDQKLFGGPGGRTKVAIPAATAGGKTVIFTNYNRLPTLKSRYRMYRPDNPQHEMKHWEIIRATTANSQFFRPYHHTPSGQSYTDSGTSCENLFTIASNEPKEIWRSSQVNSTDLFFALGSTLFRSTITGNYKRSWDDFLTKLPSETSIKKIARLDANFLEPVEYDNPDNAAYLRRVVRDNTDSTMIQKLASGLFATLFYFESRGLAERTSSGQYRVQGSILCRIADGTAEICEVGKLLKQGIFSKADFVIKEKGQELKQYDIMDYVIEDMIQKRQFRMLDAEIKTSTKAPILDLVLRLDRREMYSISGFPRSINKETNKSDNIGNRASIIQPRSHWKPPDAETYFSRHSVINDSGVNLIAGSQNEWDHESLTSTGDDLPSAALDGFMQVSELEAPELRDHDSIQLAMKMQKNNDTIELQ